MFKARNMRVMVISVVLIVLCSSVNMIPARSFLENIINNYKRQNLEECSMDYRPCQNDNDCLEYVGTNCNCKFEDF